MFVKIPLPCLAGNLPFLLQFIITEVLVHSVWAFESAYRSSLSRGLSVELTSAGYTHRECSGFFQLG